MNFLAILIALGVEQWRTFAWRDTIARTFVRYARDLERKLNGGRPEQALLATVAALVPAVLVVLAVYYAVIGVSLSSLTDRRIVAGAAVIGLFLVTSISSSLLVGDYHVEGGSAAALVNVLALPLYLRDMIFLGSIDPESALGGVASAGLLVVGVYLLVLVVAAGVLVRRYRWVER